MLSTIILKLWALLSFPPAATARLNCHCSMWHHVMCALNWLSHNLTANKHSGNKASCKHKLVSIHEVRVRLEALFWKGRYQVYWWYQECGGHLKWHNWWKWSCLVCSKVYNKKNRQPSRLGHTICKYKTQETQGEMFL